MSSLEYLCFILSCREQANKARRDAYMKYYKVEKRFRSILRVNQSVKKTHRLGLTKDLLKYQQEYRKIADFMTKQQPILRAARKAANFKTHYNSTNQIIYIMSLDNLDETYSLKQIKEIAAGYTFDKVVLIDGVAPLNPYEMK